MPADNVTVTATFEIVAYGAELHRLNMVLLP
ncbi:MAG: hypothetical protein ACLUJU_05350 [Subdoligranulum sp.]